MNLLSYGTSRKRITFIKVVHSLTAHLSSKKSQNTHSVSTVCCLSTYYMKVHHVFFIQLDHPLNISLEQPQFLYHFHIGVFNGDEDWVDELGFRGAAEAVSTLQGS